MAIYNFDDKALKENCENLKTLFDSQLNDCAFEGWSSVSESCLFLLWCVRQKIYLGHLLNLPVGWNLYLALKLFKKVWII